MIDYFIGALKGLPGVGEDLILRAETDLGAMLPFDYREFVKRVDAAKGFIGQDAYIALWPVADLAAFNKAYQVQRYAPGLILFASNGGGEGFGFDTRQPEWKIIMLPFVGMDWEDSIPQGDSFTAFLERLEKMGPFAEPTP